MDCNSQINNEIKNQKYSYLFNFVTLIIFGSTHNY